VNGSGPVLRKMSVGPSHLGFSDGTGFGRCPRLRRAARETGRTWPASTHASTGRALWTKTTGAAFRALLLVARAACCICRLPLLLSGHGDVVVALLLRALLAGDAARASATWSLSSLPMPE
jgi:hypothetical protein